MGEGGGWGGCWVGGCSKRCVVFCCLQCSFGIVSFQCCLGVFLGVLQFLESSVYCSFLQLFKSRQCCLCSFQYCLGVVSVADVFRVSVVSVICWVMPCNIQESSRSPHRSRCSLLCNLKCSLQCSLECSLCSLQCSLKRNI